jgi:hypothetical protein
MNIDIAKEDLYWLREVIREGINRMEGCPNPAAYSKAPAVARKAYKKLSYAMKAATGHDWNADKEYFPKTKPVPPPAPTGDLADAIESIPAGWQRITDGTSERGDRIWCTDKGDFIPVDAINEYAEEYICLIRYAGE